LAPALTLKESLYLQLKIRKEKGMQPEEILQPGLHSVSGTAVFSSPFPFTLGSLLIRLSAVTLAVVSQSRSMEHFSGFRTMFFLAR